ncbi:MAG: hypothetical protein IJJ48_06320 [Firmicutes bacterium]|nr:hypothetical protein [Bacillota bacterium]
MDQYRKNLLEQLRLCVIEEGQKDADDRGLVKAMSVNEELKALGFCLAAEDIVRLARSESVDSFYRDFVSMLSEVKAKPMYPDFPSQVMDMDEAKFRFHQICHYQSTYGVEEMARWFGQDYQVRRGWLPEEEDTEKTVSDEALLAAKTVRLIDEKEQYSVPLEKLLRKPEKITIQETEIVREALSHVDISALDLDIPFKKNLMPVFYALFTMDEKDQALEAMRRLCQHTGDVLKCADYCLTRQDFRLATSQKKQLVKLIESYPAEDWKANVILSGKKARRAVLVLQHISYNRFSRSEAHKEVVRMLRNGELQSWEGQAKELLTAKGEDAVSFIAKRPGMLLRWTNWLLKLGYDDFGIQDKLIENVDSLSSKTLAFALTQLGRLEGKERAYDVIYGVMSVKLSRKNTPLKGKKVFIDEGRLDIAHSMLLSKGDEAGYVRNGLAYRIPEGIRHIRFFVYWNDEDRVDIDLHCRAHNRDGSVYEIGWNEDFRSGSAVHSGDITHSNAAEYIDIDMDSDLAEVQMNINLYAGNDTFGDIDQCFVGMMAVSKLGKNVKLYDPKNCFFQSDMRSRTRTMNYGYVNVKERYLCLDDSPTKAQWMDGVYTAADHTVSDFNLGEYLGLLLKKQGCERVDKAEDADIVLVMEKCSGEGQISLIDSDFFLGDE